VALERTGCVDTVSWVKWRIDGPPQIEGLNGDGMATFQANQCDGVVMVTLPQKPVNEPYSVMAITLCEPGASAPECKPIIGPNNTVIIQITNDIGRVKNYRISFGHEVFDQNVLQIFIFDKNFDTRSKFRFSVKVSIFD